MDVGSLLAEAADETYDGDDFEGQGDQTPPTTRQTAAEILKLSAGEVARNDKVETAKILQKESENINRTEKARKEVRDSSADSSPERDGQSDLISSSLRNATETVHASDGRRNEAAHDHMYIDEGSEIALQDSDDEGDDNENDADDDDSGADPELDTELLVASYQGNIRKVVKLMGSGARYFARDRHKWTALMWAAAGGYDDIIDSIVSFVKKSKVKSFINAKDGITGWTALHVSHHH